MLKQDPMRQAPLRRVTEKTAYSKAARKKLLDSRAKLDGVTLIVRQAVDTGRLKSNGQLNRALEAVETNFNAAECQLRILQKSCDGEWEKQRAELESAWEDLAHSIKHLVTHFADGAR